jgi:hypothetical protein
LKLSDFAPLPVDLGAHPLDFGSELVKLHDVLVQPEPSQSAGAQPSPAGLPFPEAASDSFARIGVMRALNRHVERVFDTSRKDKHWGKRKLKRDE